MKIIWNILFVLLCIPHISSAQGKKELLEKYKTFATAHLDSLKNQGAIIVLLKSKSRAIEAYEKAGNQKVADEMMEHNNILNKRLIKAYKMYWNFCPVYFMYNKDIEAFNNGQRDSIFLDSTLHTSTSIHFTKSFYIFHDYGTFYEIQNKEHDTAPSKWKIDSYKNFNPSEGVQVKSDCIVVKDKMMYQYRYPFPDYVQTWGSMSGIKKAIELLNSRFINASKLGFDINAAF